jgi:elongation factor Ts
MEIKASDVKTLREKTGAGMMDCKKALVEAQGDFDKAEKILKELGLAAADKRLGKATNEGRIFSRVDGNRGVLLELTCETDFVARNEDFISLGNSLLDTILEKDLQENAAELDMLVKDTMSRIKENMSLKRFQTMKVDGNGCLVDYIHGEGRIGVLVKFALSDSSLKEDLRFKETAFDFALHVAAFAPLYVSRDRVDSDYLKEQEELLRKQTANDPRTQGKPEKIIDNIVKGKLDKHLAMICLLDQGWLRDEKIKSSKILESLNREIDATVEIEDFLYYRLGLET